MRALVTGATGFIGSHLTRALLAHGHEVHVLLRPNSPRRGNLPEDVRVILGDVLAPPTKEALPKDIDIVYHLAGMASPPEGLHDPVGCIRLNVVGTQNVLEWVRGGRVGRFVLASSVYVYGNTDSLPMREDGPVEPYSPLGASKMAAEYLLHTYATCYDVPGLIYRIFTVYGPGSRQDQLVPSLLLRVQRGEALELGEPNATRDFVYVDDVVDALLLAERYAGPVDIFNVGSGRETSVKGLVAQVLEVTGRRDTPVRFGALPARSDERQRVSRHWAAINKMRDRLGWRPVTSLRKGLEKTAASIKASLKSGG